MIFGFDTTKMEELGFTNVIGLLLLMKEIQEQEPLDDPNVLKVDEDGTRLYEGWNSPKQFSQFFLHKMNFYGSLYIGLHTINWFIRSRSVRDDSSHNFNDLISKRGRQVF